MSNEEYQPEEMQIPVNRSRPYHYRRCKRKKLLTNVESLPHHYRRRFKKSKSLTNIESLPDEMVFEILVRLPAQVIYDVIRLVCSKWYNIICTHHFINDHLKRSVARGGILFQRSPEFSSTYSLSMQPRTRRIEVSKLSYEFTDVVLATCHGLVLVTCSEKYGDDVLYIVNPVTKQRFDLPPFPRPIDLDHCFGLAYAVESMKYKVALTYEGDDKDKNYHNVELAILTVGVDKLWIRVQSDHLPLTARGLLYCAPLVTEGFMHWAGSRHVLILNVETETLRLINVPQGYVKKEKTYLSTGTVVYFVIERSELSWEMWELRSSEGEWEKMPNIELEAQKCRAQQILRRDEIALDLIGWLKYKEVMVFRVSYSHIHLAYDVHTRKLYRIKELKLPRGGVHSHIVHLNSLVQLGGAS